MFASAAAFLLERLDRKLKRPEEFEELYGTSTLAFVPHTKLLERDRKSPAQDVPLLREAFRTLRANLFLAGMESQLKTILVTSAVPSEGKSTVVRNLAFAYCESGLRVAIIEADLRKPSLSSLLGYAQRGGA